MSNVSRRGFLKVAGVAGVGAAFANLAGCSSGGTTSSDASKAADTVVYGKIYTSNSSEKYAEAFAVKDGRYVYVGTVDGASEYVKDGTTTVIDHRDKGLVMAGATEGHGHYVAAAELTTIGAAVGGSTVDEIIAGIKTFVEAHPNNTAYFTQGWDSHGEMGEKRSTYNMRAAIDEVCADKPVLMMDNVGHNAFLNSKALELAGFTSGVEVEGGSFAKDESGNLLGFVSDVAVNYAMEKVILQNEIITKSEVREAIRSAADKLHSCGYTNYFDAYTNMFGETTYAGVQEEDQQTGLTFNMIASYKVDPYADIDEKAELTKSYMEKYATTHFKANNVKLFADGGAVEAQSGWLLEGYKDGSHGNQVWSDDRMNEIVKKLNEKGVSVHVHASGDGATTQTVNAFINAEQTAAEGVYNGLGHSRHITEETKDKMAAHNIYSATNICWRYLPAANVEAVKAIMNYDTCINGYPMKSLIDRGIVMTSSTDYPANDGAPIDVCGIIEVGVNGTLAGMETIRMAEDEYLTVEEMLDVMTINGAKQFQFADERGSIEVGKYADFLLLDKDITSCDLDKIHEGKVAKVYFEGNEVYTA